MKQAIESIVVVTVTYNDFPYLKKALTALRNQTYPICRIIVVDNHSVQDDQDLLRLEEDELVEVLYLPENRGGAGGFEAGMRLAHEKYDPDWYWLMDADAAPRPNCLEFLLKNDPRQGHTGILAPLIYGVDLQKYQLYHHKKLSKLLYRDPAKFSSYDAIPSGTVPIDADAFVGPLVSRQAVETLGYADGGLFIYGDDMEYTYRVSRKFDVLLVKDAVIDHRDPPTDGKQKPTQWWKEYYTFRNWVLFIEKYKKNTLHGIICLFMLRLRLLKQLVKALFSNDSPKLKKLHQHYLLLGYSDGKKGKKGMTVDPVKARREVMHDE